VLDDRARQSIAGRETLRAQLVAMEDKSEREYPAKLAKRERLLKAAKDAEAAAKAAAVALARFTAESATASLEYTRTHEEIVGRLRAGANNVLIDAFIAEMKDDMAATRKAVRSVERAKTNARTGRSSMVIDSNGDSVATRMLALAEALRQAGPDLPHPRVTAGGPNAGHRRGRRRHLTVASATSANFEKRFGAGALRPVVSRVSVPDSRGLSTLIAGRCGSASPTAALIAWAIECWRVAGHFLPSPGIRPACLATTVCHRPLVARLTSGSRAIG
jgi:hypothetical protein